MKKTALIIGLFSAGFAFSQNSQRVIYLLDGNLTASKSFNNSGANNPNIESVNVIKDKNNAGFPASLKQDFDTVIAIKSKEITYDRVALASLNQQFGLERNNPVYFDGTLFGDTSLKITPEGMKEMSVAEKNGKKNLYIYSQPQK